MVSKNEVERFSTSWKSAEVKELQTYIEATGVDRNELIRRATLAHVRIESGKAKDHKKAYKEVGPLYDKGGK